MKQCVIFDMDGVIINSEPLHQECERKVFQMLGVAVSEEEHHALVGTTDENMWKTIALKCDLPVKIEEAIELKKSMFLKYLKQETRLQPIPYIPELLAELRRHNFTLALASSSPHEQIEFILSSLGLKPYFQAIVSGEDVAEGKPHPEIFLKAAELAGAVPGKCVVIEDSYNGVMAAKRANMSCIGFINPDSGNQNLSKADKTIHSFQEISVKMIKSML